MGGQKTRRSKVRVHANASQKVGPLYRRSRASSLALVYGLGFRVWSLGFRVWGVEFRVWGIQGRVQGLESSV